MAPTLRSDRARGEPVTGARVIAVAIGVALAAGCSSAVVTEIYPGRYSVTSQDADDLYDAVRERCPAGYDVLDHSEATVHGETEMRFQEWKNGVKPPDWDYKYALRLPFESTFHGLEAQCRIRDVGAYVAELASYIQRAPEPACPAVAAYIGACQPFALQGERPPNPACAHVRAACAKVRTCAAVEQTCGHVTWPPLDAAHLQGEWQGPGATLSLRQDIFMGSERGVYRQGIWSFRDGRLVLSSVTDGKLDGWRQVLDVVDRQTRAPILRGERGYYLPRTLEHRR